MKIAIDAGHGSNTAGKRTPDGYREHWANVKVANYFAQAMERCGIAYIKTGWDDEDATNDADTPLATRQKAIKNAKCDYSISFHFNAFGDGKSYNEAEGVGTFISSSHPNDSQRMANAIQAELIKGTVQKNRGVKSSNLAMCNCSIMGTKASILCECAFMTNKRESLLMQSDEFCKECAEESARGFCNYVGVKYVAENTPAPKPTPAPVLSVAVHATYRVRSNSRWLPEVTDLEDYAGLSSAPMTALTIKVDKGSVKYRVHTKETGWLPYVTGYGTILSSRYAGDCKHYIDAVEVYYFTPDSIRPYKCAKYRVAPVSGNYYPWQIDDNKDSGMDGYAGVFGKPIGKFQLIIE